MIRNDDSNFLLFIEPNIEDKSEEPVVDELVTILMLAIQDAKKGVSNYSRTEDKEVWFKEGTGYKGVHHNCDGACSANYDLLLPNGMITNTLAIHYLKYFRKAIPESDFKKLQELQRFYGRVDARIPLSRW